VTNTIKRKTKLKINFYLELLYSILAILSLFSLVLLYFGDLSQNQLSLLSLFDLSVAIIFLSDFFIRLILAKNKKHYFKDKWFYLLASVPVVDNWSEILRVLRILGLIQIINSGKHINKHITKKRHRHHYY